MNIVCAINKNYIVQFCTMATSLLLNTSSKDVDFFILNKDLLKSDEEEILNYIKRINSFSNVHFIKVKIKDLSSLLTKDTHLTEETFYRLFMSEFLPEDLEKVLYLDSDIIIEKDINELYSTNISNYLLGAVTDYNSERWKTLKLSTNLDYFNAGVMLINLNKFRTDNLVNKCKEFIKNSKVDLIYADQDILNSVIKGQWLRLDSKWNVIRQWFMKDPYLFSFISENYLEEVINNPAIIHYTSSIKPWKLICDHPKKDRYLFYLNKVDIKEHKKLNEVLLNKEFVIFGAGLAGKKMFNLLKETNLSVGFFLDNDKNKSGINFLGLKVIHPDNFLKKENQFIIIASQYEREIANQLEKLGYSQNKDFAVGLHGLCKLI